MKFTLYRQVQGVLTTIDKFDLLKVKMGTAYFSLLKGLEIDPRTSEIGVYGAYTPLFTYERCAGQIIVDLTLWRKSSLRMILQRRRPYISIIRIEQVNLEEVA